VWARTTTIDPIKYRAAYRASNIHFFPPPLPLQFPPHLPHVGEHRLRFEHRGFDLIVQSRNRFADALAFGG